MQLQFRKSLLQCLEQGIQEVKNTELTQEIRLGEGMPDVGRILGTWSQCLLRSKQWQGDEIEVSGGVKTWTLYLPEEGSEPRVVEGWLPFQQRWNSSSPGKTGTICVQPLIRYADGRSITARKIMLRIGLGMLCRTYLPMAAEIYEPEELPADLALLRQTYPMRLPVEAGEKTFSLDEEVAFPLAGTDWKILTGMLHPEVTEQRVLNEKVMFKGKGNLQLLCRNSDGDIQPAYLELPFAQLAQLEGDWGDSCNAEVSVEVTDLETDLLESGQLRIKCSLVGQYLVDQERSITVAEDAYCPNRQVRLECTNLQLPAVLEDRLETISLEQTMTGQSGQVICCAFLPDHPKQRQGTDAVHLELSGQMQVLFYGTDGSLQGGTAHWENNRDIPASDNCRMFAQVCPLGQMQAMSNAEQIGASCKLQLTSRSYCMTEIPMIAEITYSDLEEPRVNSPSLILRRTGRRSLWEIAKECGSTVEAIRQANRLDGDPTGDRMLLIPVL